MMVRAQADVCDDLTSYPVPVFDRLKEFTVEGNRAPFLMQQLKEQSLLPPTAALAECGGPSGAILLLDQWTRSPDAFVHAIRHDLDCNNDCMVSKMEFRRWAGSGVLLAVLNSMARAGTATETASDDEAPPACCPAAAPATQPPPAVHAPTPQLHAPALLPPPPNCPFPIWTAHKQTKTQPESSLSASAEGSVLKGPGFSDQCEAHYQAWRSDMKSPTPRHVTCTDGCAELNFLAMEVKGPTIGTPFMLIGHTCCSKI